MKITYKSNNNGGALQTPTRIIIHAMSEYILGLHASDFLIKMGLSAHYLIEPNGDIIACRTPNKMAWHAKNHNRNTIGIELLIKGEHNYRQFIEKLKTNYADPEQIKSLINLCNPLIDEYSIEKVERHSDIDPKRKYDPGSGFDWEYFKSKLNI